MAIEDSHLQVPATLEFAGKHVRDVASTVISELETLKNQIQPLQETWTGDAYNYFTVLEQEWNNSALGLFGDNVAHPGLLGNIAMALDSSWYNYAVTQQANTYTWKM